MSLKEISKKLITLTTWKNSIITVIMSLIFGIFVTKSIVYGTLFSICYAGLVLISTHVILVLKVKRKLKNCKSKTVFYCQTKKSVYMVHHFLLVEEEGKIVMIPFEYGNADLKTDYTVGKLKQKDHLDVDGKAYNLIRLR